MNQGQLPCAHPSMQAGDIHGGKRQHALVVEHAAQPAKRVQRIHQMFEHVEHHHRVAAARLGLERLDRPLYQIDAEQSFAGLDRPAAGLDALCIPSRLLCDREEQPRIRAHLQQPPAGQQVAVQPVEHPSEQLAPAPFLGQVLLVHHRRVVLDDPFRRVGRPRAGHAAVQTADDVIVAGEAAARAGELADRCLAGDVGRIQQRCMGGAAERARVLDTAAELRRRCRAPEKVTAERRPGVRGSRCAARSRSGCARRSAAICATEIDDDSLV